MYNGDAHFGASESSLALMTVSTRPSLRVAKQTLIIKRACPSQSGGCLLTSSVVVTPRAAKQAITLKRHSAKLKAGTSRRVRFRLSRRARGALRSDLRRHPNARLRVTLRIVVVDGNGSKGTQTLSFSVRGTRARSLLGMS